MKLLLLSILFAVFASGASRMIHMENSLSGSRNDYSRAGVAEGSTEHEVVFAVKQKNIDQLEALLYEVSDPSHAKYGQHLTRVEVADLTSNVAGTQLVSDYLVANGVQVTKYTPYGEYITAKATIAQWQELLATTFYSFHHNDDTTRNVIRSDSYFLPEELTEHVSAVFNTVQMPRRKPAKKHITQTPVTEALSAFIPGAITPALLNSYYHITSNKGNSKASQAVFESLNQYYSPANLAEFQTDFSLPIQPVAADVNGHANDTHCSLFIDNCVEGNLDVMYMMAVSQATPMTYWYSRDDSAPSFSDELLTWMLDMVASQRPPLVNSISYGSYEFEEPLSSANAFNVEAMKLGVQGVSIFVSSGDDGVANYVARESSEYCGYYPSFPASSPYVTAIAPPWALRMLQPRSRVSLSWAVQSPPAAASPTSILPRCIRSLPLLATSRGNQRPTKRCRATPSQAAVILTWLWPV